MLTRYARRAGFTLIELLVVVAIIALLISILLPSLTRAREAGKSAKCLANLRSIGVSMAQYFVDNKDWFPFEKRSFPPPALTQEPVTAFYYGGHPGWEGWWGYDREPRRTTFRGRPFNPYLFDNLPDYEIPFDDAKYLELAKSLEQVFGCPSDTGGFWNSETADDENAPVPLYRFVGASYDMQYMFIYRWATRIAAPGDNPPSYSQLNYLHRANRFLNEQRKQHVSRFVILYEDPLDSGLFDGVGRAGWHRQWNRHNVLYLDSHASSTFFNISGINRTSGVPKNQGVGWKTCAGFWFSNMDDPDYYLRTLSAR